MSQPLAAQIISADAPTRGGSLVAWLLRQCESLLDHANPILVKEVRQALKSRQFLITFVIVLVACWGASFAVVAIVGPDVFYVASGPQMLLVYAIILSVPLTLIVPHTAFRSIAAEQEDNTYDLLSITSLTARQIVTGKLGSAAAQMLVYLCAVSPCIAFTYLLRGVDTPSILFLLVLFVLLSLGLSMIALAAGTCAKAKHTQSLISILLILFLAGVLIGTVSFCNVFVNEALFDFVDSWFWLACVAILSFYVVGFAFFHAAATAQIAFRSENRSTPLRKGMLALQGTFIGWMAILPFTEGFHPQACAISILMTVLGSTLFWYVMGTLLTSEWPHLSRRVLRSLPTSTVGRVFLTWLNPGPHTGFVFAIASLTAVDLAAAVLTNLVPVAGTLPRSEIINYTISISWCYTVIFLGLGKLLIAAVRRFTFVQMSAGFLLHLVLMLLASGTPQIMVLMTPSLRMGDQFNFIQFSNPVSTLGTLVSSGPLAVDANVLLMILLPLAAIVFLINLRSIGSDMRLEARAMPERVLQDEAVLHPPQARGAQSPWDSQPAES